MKECRPAVRKNAEARERDPRRSGPFAALIGMEPPAPRETLAMMVCAHGHHTPIHNNDLISAPTRRHAFWQHHLRPPQVTRLRTSTTPRNQPPATPPHRIARTMTPPESPSSNHGSNPRVTGARWTIGDSRSLGGFPEVLERRDGSSGGYPQNAPLAVSPHSHHYRPDRRMRPPKKNENGTMHRHDLYLRTAILYPLLPSLSHRLL